MAHRLWALEGKCQQLHGHTWTAILEISGDADQHGIIIDFHVMKEFWRGFLDSLLDHRLALDARDPLIARLTLQEQQERFPGIYVFDGMPTVESLAKWMGWKAIDKFGRRKGRGYRVELWEGDNNCATWSFDADP